MFTGRARLLMSLAVAVALGVVSVPAQGHHGASMFEEDRLITVNGAVTSFDWSNPRAMIYPGVKDDKGDVPRAQPGAAFLVLTGGLRHKS